jgi:rare lipoprotein A
LRRLRAQRRWLGVLALLPLAWTAATATGLAETTTNTAPIDASKASVRIGNQFALRGSFEGASDHPVQIQHRPNGAGRWRTVARTRTNADGAYRIRVKPRRTGRWRARLTDSAQTQSSESSSSLEAGSAAMSGPRETAARRVTVRSRTRARVGRRHLTAGDRVRVNGRVRPAGRRKVIVRVAGRAIKTRTRPNGRFSVRWQPSSTGGYRVRVRAGKNRRAIGSRRLAGRVIVYRPASSSWYGPGFYGNRTACGHTLTPSTLGVAHRSMPCGTRLRLRHRGRTVVVRVIDRGPYVAGRELDLTYATKRRLGFGDVGTVLMSR